MIIKGEPRSRLNTQSNMQGNGLFTLKQHVILLRLGSSYWALLN